MRMCLTCGETISQSASTMYCGPCRIIRSSEEATETARKAARSPSEKASDDTASAMATFFFGVPAIWGLFGVNRVFSSHPFEFWIATTLLYYYAIYLIFRWFKNLDNPKTPKVKPDVPVVTPAAKKSSFKADFKAGREDYIRKEAEKMGLTSAPQSKPAAKEKTDDEIYEIYNINESVNNLSPEDRAALIEYLKKIVK